MEGKEIWANLAPGHGGMQSWSRRPMRSVLGKCNTGSIFKSALGNKHGAKAKGKDLVPSSMMTDGVENYKRK